MTLLHRLGFSASEVRQLTNQLTPAGLLRAELARHGVLAVRLMGPPGAGKTELLDSTLKRISKPERCAMIIVNPAAERDAKRLQGCCNYVETVSAAVPYPPEICHAINRLPLHYLDYIFIEACGGLAPLADLGQDVTVATLATSGGDDKAAEYAALLRAASLVLLTKIELRSVVRFDDRSFRQDVGSINPSTQMIETSTQTGKGFAQWLEWLDQQRLAKKSRLMTSTHRETNSSDLFAD